MPIQIVDRTITRMKLIDDDPKNREAWSFPIEDLDIEPVLEEGPISDMQNYIATMGDSVDAILCDHHLKVKKGYSEINGAELVSMLHLNGLPAILCTRFEDRLDEIRRYRKHIPVWLNPDDLKDIDNIARGLEICVEEIYGHLRPSRNPWRTLVRIEDIDSSISDDNPYIEFVLPTWDRNRVIRMPKNDFPKELHAKLEPGYRCYAKVNTGAEQPEDLYFDWEVK